MNSGGFYAPGTAPDPTICVLVPDPPNPDILDCAGNEPGDGKVNLAITGTVTIDDNGTSGNGSDDTIAFVLTIAAGERSTSTSTGHMTETWTSIEHTLTPYLVDSATANGSGGFDYVIGSAGMMIDICTDDLVGFPGSGGCFGESEHGSDLTGDPAVDVNVWTRPPDPPADWDIGGFPSNVNYGVGGINNNAGAVTTALPPAGYTCADSSTNPVAPFNDPDCAPIDGLGEDGFAIAYSNGVDINGNQDGANWDNLIMTVSTDLSGNVVSVKGFYVYMYDIILSGFNSWVGGSFSLATANTIPVAVDDPTNAAAVNTPVNIDVLANDTDLDDGVDFVTVTSGPSNGTAVKQLDNTITYTSTNFAGTDSFTYTITDLTQDTSNTATVKVQIADLPPLAVDDSSSTEVGVLKNIDVLANDTLGDEPITGVTIDVGTEVNGTAAVQGNDSVNFSPTGIDGSTGLFDYTLTDADGDTSTATVSVFISNAPNANPDFPLPTDVSTALDIPVLANDSGLTDTPLQGVTFPVLPANGALSQTGCTAKLTCIVTYTNNGTPGPDSFDYTVTDNGGLFDTATVTITVNDLPVAVDDDLGTVNAGTSTPVSVLANDSGLSDVPLLVVTTASPPANGTATAAGCTAVGTCVVTYANDGTPGADSFDYTVTDANGDFATATVTVNVNDIPVANDDTANTLTDTLVNINVLANDSGLGDTPVAVMVTLPASNGVAAEQPDNTVDYTPAAGISGVADSFDYTVTDSNGDSATATVTVNVAAPTIPMAVDDSATTDQDTAVTINVLANDLELVDTPITLGLAPGSTPANGSVTINGSPGVNVASISLTYTPDAGFFGTDTFIYEVSDADGDSDTATVTITVNEVMDEVVITIPGGSSSFGPWGLALLLIFAVPVLRRRWSGRIH